MGARHDITIDGETTQVANAAEVVVALDALQGQHHREVLEQLRDDLPELIGSERGLYDTLKMLAPEDQAFLVAALGTDLAGAVASARSLRDILATLAHHEVEEQLLRGPALYDRDRAGTRGSAVVGIRPVRSTGAGASRGGAPAAAGAGAASVRRFPRPAQRDRPRKYLLAHREHLYGGNKCKVMAGKLGA